MSKIKTFLTDSQPGYVLKILVNLSLNVLIGKVLMRKKKKKTQTRKKVRKENKVC